MIRVTDMHCHILPHIDDGSRNSEVSREMLKVAADQGIDRIIATPHFYADREKIDDYLIRRNEAYEKVLRVRTSDSPEILLGAEVAFFDGISRADRISELAVQGSNVFLLELPFEPWDKDIYEEITYLAEKRSFRLILAHIERYMGFPGNKKWIEKLQDIPVYLQVNASSLCDWRMRHGLVRMFKKGQAHFLGSDAHGLHRRPINLAEGREVLAKKLGSDFIAQMDSQAENLFENQ